MTPEPIQFPILVRYTDTQSTCVVRNEEQLANRPFVVMKTQVQEEKENETCNQN